ncbi:MAG: hypothetical protein QY322_03780 [bacterium]|nr:MAG: hypothetical protein QY322_03780 [bacterium]
MAGKTATGLNKETSGALAYVLGPITGVLFLILEKDSFVRFHAMQSIVVFVGLFAIQAMLGITIILAILVPLVGIVGFILWLMLIYKAWQGEEWEVPFLGKFARQILKKA